LSTGDDRAAGPSPAERAVELQRIFLRNPLPAGPGICCVCRGCVDPRFQRCYQCSQHRLAAGARTADVVVPVAYAVKGGQHAHNLTVYKAAPPSPRAQFSLSALGLAFLGRHWRCLSAAGGRLTHVATVPSTRDRQGPHPIEVIVGRRVGLPLLRFTANAGYPSSDRDFHRDRFRPISGSAAGCRVLLLDDTWTTGGRLQSMAFALKDAGAVSVAAVVLGRHVNPAYGPSAAVLELLRAAPWFDMETCGAETR
jgi:hypothetical protein